MLTKHLKQFVSDKNGKITIMQMPNFLLWLWISIKLVMFFIHDNSLKMHASNLSKAVIFAWAYLEITQGSSYFRRTLGLVVILVTIFSFFA